MFKRIIHSEFIRVFTFFEKRFWIYILALIGDKVIIAICYNIIFAFIVKDLFNAAYQTDKGLLFRAIFLVSLSTLFACIVRPICVYFLGTSVRSTVVDIRNKVFKKLLELPVKSFEASHTGDFIVRVTGDINMIEGLYTGQLGGLVFTIILGFSAMISIIVLDWRIGLPLIGLGVLLLITNYLFSKALRKSNDKIRVLYSKMVQAIVDLFSGIHISKMFQLEKVTYDEVAKRNDLFTYECKEIGNIYVWLNSANTIFSQLSTTGMVLLGVFMWIRGYIDVGTIMAIYALQGNMNGMFTGIGGIVTGIQSSMSGISRVFEILDAEIEIEQQGQVIEESEQLPNLSIEFADVSFAYKDNVEVLQNFNLLINENKKVAFIGESGAGKSTVIKLLLGFYKTTSGCIFIGGKPIKDFALSQLRQLIAYVPQEPVLFNDTILNNIMMGCANITKEEAIEAAKAANAHEFIICQAEGYNTIISEKGRNLSGGQKQRIAIARALAKNAPILVLDEATSALDSESEGLVQEAINNLMKGRTVLVIAHRLSTVVNSDTIYVIGEGKVLESGNHDELLCNGIFYKRLYEKHFRGSLA